MSLLNMILTFEWSRTSPSQQRNLKSNQKSRFNSETITRVVEDNRKIKSFQTKALQDKEHCYGIGQRRKEDIFKTVEEFYAEPYNKRK